MSRWPCIALFSVLALSPLFGARAADETSSGDKLRILYSSRFTFTDGDVPLVTVAIMEGQRQIRLGAAGGVIVRPDGPGGAEIDAGEQWTITAEGARAGAVREWTVVERLPPDDTDAADAAEARWQERGHRVARFEVGTVFAVAGEVMDTRELLVAIDPVAAPGGAARARAIGERYGIAAEVHAELVRRPEGTIVARSGDVTIENPAVIWFAPARAGATIEVRDVVTGGGGSQRETGTEDRRYFGAVYVTIGSDGKLVVANAVASDDLLAGLVPAEMFPSAPAAALEAQAIAARTELLQKIGTRHLGDPYLLCSTQHCQVYAGAGNEHPRTTRAVRATRGQVLVRDGGGLVDARYSAACGGHSEHNESVWGGRADTSLRGRFDGAPSSDYGDGVSESEIERFLDIDPAKAWCGRTRFSKARFRWRARIDAAQLDRAFARTHPRVGSIRAFEALERGVSGRITKLRVRGSKGSTVIHGELAIRRALGGLRSSLFVSSALGSPGSPTAFEFRGGGFGHGVGMCQLGAMGMAKAGRSAEAILRHYYPSSTVHRLF